MSDEKKTKWIKVRVTESEKSVIDEKAQAAGVTVANLIRESLCRVRTWTLADKETERERIREIRRIGQNLNQIARWCNQHKSAAESAQVIAHLVAIEKRLEYISLPPMPPRQRWMRDASDSEPEGKDAH